MKKEPINVGQLSRITIEGVNGQHTIDAHIRDNKLVLVGENGSGKTTFLRIVFNVLAGRAIPLSQLPFDNVTVWIGSESVRIAKSDLTNDLKFMDARMRRELHGSLRGALQQLIESGANTADPSVLERLSSRHGIPVHYLFDELGLFDSELRKKESKSQKAFQQLSKLLSAQVLYLPTYRRIERELASIIEDFDGDEYQRKKMNRRRHEAPQSFIELVEFGMEDVKQAIDRVQGELREYQRRSLSALTLQYLSDIVTEEYSDAETKVFLQASEEDIASVLSRMDESILPKNKRKVWQDAVIRARTAKTPNEHDKIVRLYMQKILQFQQSLTEREQRIRSFCEICNRYMPGKQFRYDASEFEFSVVISADQRERKIELRDLSSGEKQVVSLFSHLYLSGSSKFFVLIDEPELSLSVPWQKRFLEDIAAGSFCTGLIAVTHSPYIYSNSMEKYTRALGEFVK